ncbi:MAG: glycosyltransferase family 2 protein, partial [Gammaproteobacteria bacterium]
MTTSRNPLVSILTPTYNHSAYIGSCIESVLAQSYSNWEQIVIDDGSTDDTRAVIARFRDSRIRYLRQENQGIFQIAGTYNRALSLSRGSLIAPLEGDDFWPRDRLAVSVPAFDDPAVVISHGLCRSITPPGIPCATEISAPAMQSSHRATLFNDPVGAACSAMLQFGSVLTTALGNSWPATACCDFQTAPSLGSHVNCLRDNPMTTALIRRSALEAIGGFRQVPGLPVMDYPTLVELALQGKFFFFNQVMCHWRMHGGNSSERYRDD